MFSTFTKTMFSVMLVTTIFSSCQKQPLAPQQENRSDQAARNNESNGHLQQTKTFSSDVVVRWLNQQLNMFRLPLAAGSSAPPADRVWAYSGISLYEAVVPGMPAYRSLGGQLTDFPQMPATEPGKAYHWAASANAALASINRSLFANTSSANKQLMDQLEAELQAQYATEVDAQTLQRSVQFGRAVAQAVWAWAQGDGTAVIAQQPAFTIPAGMGYWTKEYTAAAAANPYHHLRRQMVAGSRDEAAAPQLPFGFSTATNSDFYNMAKEVYDISQNLTTEQRNIALYHREGSGYGGGSSVAGQLAAVFTQANARLDNAALAFAKVGIGSFEAQTLTFIQKYHLLVMRPISYIRNYMGYTTWSTLYTTPPYPEYPAGHPTNGGVLATMLTDVFGANFPFDVDYYNYLGQPSRHYNSFEELAQEMAIARVYAGIHYKPAVYAGVQLGKKVAQNILSNLKFLKE